MVGSDGLTDQPLGAKRKRAIILRTGCFFVAMVALLAASRSGTGLPTVVTVLAVYVATAVLWVRGQYATSIAPDQTIWTPPYRLSAPLTVLSLIVVGVGLGTDSGTTFIAGLAASYFCAGYLVMRVRVEARKSTRFWGTWLGVCAVAVAIGLAIPSSKPALLVAVLGAVLTPIALGVLAGRAITALTDGSPARLWRRSWSRRQVAAIGGLAVAVGAALSLSRVGNLSMVIGLVCLGLAVVGLVSNTYADIAAVILVVALLGITPHHETFPKGLIPAEGDANVLVALGDSYMSGEGARVFYEGTDDGDNQCHRSPTSWAAMAGSRLPFDRLVFLACSGASTYNVRSERQPTTEPGSPEPENQYDEPGTQLDQYADRVKAGFTPKLVVIGLGGNDAGFSTIAAMCLAPGDCKDKGRELWSRNLPAVQAELAATFAEVRGVFDSTPVVVVGYPDPIYSPTKAEIAEGAPRQDCSNVALSTADREFVEEFIGDLDATVEAAAQEVEGFTYLAQMEDSLEAANLQLCDPRNENRPGLNFIGLRSVDGIAEQRFDPKNWYHNSLHPNERGHAAMLQTFETWLATEPTAVASSDLGTWMVRRSASSTRSRTARPPATRKQAPGSAVRPGGR